MTKCRKFVFALTGLAVICVCAAMAAPMGACDGTGPKGMMNEDRMQEMIQKIQADGVDTTALETAPENGDRESVHTFMRVNRPADAPAMNEERMQQMIEKMQANGVDTTALETALENGDCESVHTFMQENRPADAGTGFRQGISFTR